METLETETVKRKYSFANSFYYEKIIYTLHHGFKITVNYAAGPCQILNASPDF